MDVFANEELLIDCFRKNTCTMVTLLKINHAIAINCGYCNNNSRSTK